MPDKSDRTSKTDQDTHTHSKEISQEQDLEALRKWAENKQYVYPGECGTYNFGVNNGESSVLDPKDPFAGNLTSRYPLNEHTDEFSERHGKIRELPKARDESEQVQHEHKAKQEHKLQGIFHHKS